MSLAKGKKNKIKRLGANLRDIRNDFAEYLNRVTGQLSRHLRLLERARFRLATAVPVTLQRPRRNPAPLVWASPSVLNPTLWGTGGRGIWSLRGEEGREEEGC